MACGKPVIVSNLPGVRTVLENNQTGFIFENRKVEDLVNKVNKLFDDPKKYQKFCQNARNRVVEKFSDKIILKKLIQIYQSLKN